MTTWQPTHAHLRATAVGFGLLVPGVAFARPDLVVLATPLVVAAVWATLARPAAEPDIDCPVTALTVYEAEEFTWTAKVSSVPGLQRVVTFHQSPQWLDAEPENGRVVEASATGAWTETPIAMRATRWGRRTLPQSAVAAFGAWCAWRWGPVPLPETRLTVLPVTAPDDSRAPVPHPRGLVGMEQSLRLGDGSEFAKVRPFRPGDRLRRIHWPVSARTRELHVTATYADEDARVLVLVDAMRDLGESRGIEDAPSSMDIATRAASAISEHFLRRGDRVELRVFGAWGVSRVPVASGLPQLRRILDTLTLIRPGTARGERTWSTRMSFGEGTLVMMLSPLVDPAATDQVAELLRAGNTVAVIDTLPHDATVTTDDERSALAWRMRMLERRLEQHRLATLGVPVVRWRGPHSLDLALRTLIRQRAIPRRMVR
ncbi:MAG: DUF58 domain-containing protein [Aeromicrobium sp.]